MKAMRAIIASFWLALISPFAIAQGVPIAPGVYGCNGAAQAGPCNGSSSNGAPSATSPGGVIGYEIAPAKWADRWGAIAADGAGTAGIVANMASKKQAEKSAISECKKRGGGACAIRLAYYNQCAAVIAGITGSNNARAPTEQEAIAIGMQSCERANGQGGCRVYYSGCSLPQQVQ